MKLKMRPAITLIELVFVIVIVAVLSLTSLPKFMGLADDAHTAKLQHFVGILNNSIGSQLWAEVQRREPNTNGSVRDSLQSNTITDRYTSIPAELNNGASIPLANCADAGTPISTSITPIVVANFGGYKIGCIDSDLSISPHFFLHDSVNIITK